MSDVVRAEHTEAEQPRLLDRLQLSVQFRNDDNISRVGASVVVGKSEQHRKTVWLPGSVWDGVAYLIVHTPSHMRPAVAELLRVIECSLTVGEPAQMLLWELADEVETPGYTDRQTERGGFDLVW